ncbi:MAG TPA: SDR family NAD(P)-dependent oxidoreductase [Acidimicrobiales bacterium]|nr:SDR family NAD(P)-dependent oxidoreductase [Acidimicrobiales bacterium]
MELIEASALVTGGASGLGAATSRRLAEAGARVTVVDLGEDQGNKLAAEIGGTFFKADVTDPAQVQAAVDHAASESPLRVAVNCAGVGSLPQRTVGRDGSPMDLQMFTKTVTINLIGTFNVMRLAAAAMSKLEPANDDGERGVIVNTASIAAFDGQIGQVAYSASKGGVVSMTLPAARDLSPVGIRVLTIAPGTFDTPMLALLPQEARDALGAGIPFPKRLGKPEEFAALVAHIVSNSALNGEVIRLDGALRMPPK